MITIALTQEDVVRLEVIETDRDEQEALKFIRERILPEVRRQKGMKMHSHLDGGKGSAL